MDGVSGWSPPHGVEWGGPFSGRGFLPAVFIFHRRGPAPAWGVGWGRWRPALPFWKELGVGQRQHWLACSWLVCRFYCCPIHPPPHPTTDPDPELISGSALSSLLFASPLRGGGWAAQGQGALVLQPPPHSHHWGSWASTPEPAGAEGPRVDALLRRSPVSGPTEKAPCRQLVLKNRVESRSHVLARAVLCMCGVLP